MDIIEGQTSFRTQLPLFPTGASVGGETLDASFDVWYRGSGCPLKIDKTSLTTFAMALVVGSDRSRLGYG